MTLRSAEARRYLLKSSVWVQVSMEDWASPCPDADDDFDECDTSFKYDLFNASPVSVQKRRFCVCVFFFVGFFDLF